MTKMMQALTASAAGHWKDVLRMDTNVPMPSADSLLAHQVLIRVAYADLNPVDLQKLNQAQKEWPFVSGFSGSGIVQHVGCDGSEDELVDACRRVQPGDAVVFLTATGGAYAEYVVADRRAVSVLPKGISLAHASTLPLAGCTAYEALVKLRLLPAAPPPRSCFDPPHAAITEATWQGAEPTAPTTKPRRLLIVGAAGGVGSWATLLAQSAADAGLEIIATASSDASQAWCRDHLGADLVIGHDEIVQLGGGPNGSVDFILCLTEPVPSLWKDLAEVICPYGTICCVVAGPSIQSLDAGFLFFKAAHLVFQTVFTSFRTDFAHGTPHALMNDMLRRMVQGELGPRLPISPHPCNGQDWHQVVESPQGLLEGLASGHTQGKLYMTIGGEHGQAL